MPRQISPCCQRTFTCRAVHKLIAPQVRINTAECQAKAINDTRRSAALLDVLLLDPAYELQEVWREALGRGSARRNKLFRDSAALPEATRSGLFSLTEVKAEDLFKKLMDHTLRRDRDER